MNDTANTCENAVPRLTVTLLRESVYHIPDLGDVTYRLWRMTPDPRYTSSRETYAVELRGLGMARMLRIGQDAPRASEIFELLVRHTVTPCALADVLEELAGDRAPLM